jgi:hypothetical protein
MKRQIRRLNAANPPGSVKDFYLVMVSDCSKKSSANVIERTPSSSQHKRTIKIIRRHEQLQTQLGRNIDVRHIFRVLVLLVVIKVLADLL